MALAYVLRANGHDVEVGYVDSHPGQSFARCEACGWLQVHVMLAHSDTAAHRHVACPTTRPALGSAS